MKPKITQAYLRFSANSESCLGNHLCLFPQTSGNKANHGKELEYDHIYAKELSLSNSMDSIYQYMKLMNTSPKINDKAPLQNVVSTQMNLLKYVQGMDTKIFAGFTGSCWENLNIFLGVKDSIRPLTSRKRW